MLRAATMQDRPTPGTVFLCLSREKTLLLAILAQSDIVAGTMVVRMRHTRSHSANRRSHHALKSPEMAVCKNCGAMHRPHHMCLACGFYNGRIVIDMKAKAEARAARMTAKREAIRAEAGQPVEAEAAK